jgi:hypothetical protein
MQGSDSLRLGMAVLADGRDNGVKRSDNDGLPR